MSISLQSHIKRITKIGGRNNANRIKEERVKYIATAVRQFVKVSNEQSIYLATYIYKNYVPRTKPLK